MAKVLRRVAVFHRALHNEDKTSSYSKAVEVKDPSSDSVLSSLRTTGVPRPPSEACCEKMRHFCELLLLLNGV